MDGKHYRVLSEPCPKCGHSLIHNNRGIECGEMYCDYMVVGSEPYRNPKGGHMSNIEGLLKRADELLVSGIARNKCRITEQLIRDLANHIRDDGWRPIESAPKDISFLGIILTDRFVGEPFIAEWNEEDSRYECKYFTEPKPHIPTHWLSLEAILPKPLPSPPADNKEQK